MTTATDTLTPLIGDFITWLDRKPRTYSEANETWRTSCPRLPVWEEAFDRGLVRRVREDGSAYVVLTAAGRAALADGDMRARKELPPARILRRYFDTVSALRVFSIAAGLHGRRAGAQERQCPRCLALDFWTGQRNDNCPHRF